MAGLEALIARGSLVLPEKFAFPKSNRRGCVQVGELLFVSGHPPAGDGSVPVYGKVPSVVSEAEAYRCARSASLCMLASIRSELGNLDRIRRVVKLFGMVNADLGFEREFAVIDGASDLFIDLLGSEAGQHARSAVGMFDLPRGIPVEIEGIFQLH